MSAELRAAVIEAAERGLAHLAREARLRSAVRRHGYSLRRVRGRSAWVVVDPILEAGLIQPTDLDGIEAWLNGKAGR